MREGKIAVYYGAGKGKTSVSLGRGILALGENERVVMIQFMDYHSKKELALLENMEPDFRIFHFEKYREDKVLTEEAKKEIASEIKNAFNFTKKILDTGECEMLMLDGILECIEYGYLTEEEVLEMLARKPDTMDMILTGNVLTKGVAEKADYIYQIAAEKMPQEI